MPPVKGTRSAKTVTRDRNTTVTPTKRQLAAHEAWRTMRSGWWRARRAAERSQTALREWAKQHGWHLVFLDAASGFPRTGIVDAVLVRIAPGKPDLVQLRLVQLKGGNSGLTPREAHRLENAAQAISAEPLFALYDGERLCFSKPEEFRPELRRARTARRQSRSPSASRRSHRI